jgi:hypothetical protein
MTMPDVDTETKTDRASRPRLMRQSTAIVFALFTGLVFGLLGDALFRVASWHVVPDAYPSSLVCADQTLEVTGLVLIGLLATGSPSPERWRCSFARKP